MTSTTDTDQHPDISEISELVEGLLSPSRTADLRGHVDTCALCSDVHTSLAEIRTLLGSLPGPQVMPADIAGRIDAALATEASLTTVPPVEACSVSRETEHGTEADDGGERIGGGMGPRQDPTVEPEPGVIRPSGRPRGATGPGRRPARRRRRTAILGTALGAAVVGVSVFLLQSVQPSQDAASQMADSGAGVKESSGQNFSEGTLEGRVDALLSNTAARESQNSGAKEPSVDTKSSPDGVSPDAASPRSPLSTPVVSVPACVLQGTGRQTTAIAVEEGRYQGTDAFLVVLPHATDADRVQAYVIDATCVDAAPATKGRLLLTHAYTRR